MYCLLLQAGSVLWLSLICSAVVQVQHLTVMSMELHARTRRDLEPDPEFDPICALFYCLSSDSALPDSDSKQITGAVIIDRDCRSAGPGQTVTELTRCVLLVFTVIHINNPYTTPCFLLLRRLQEHSAPAGQVWRHGAAGQLRGGGEGAL